MTTRAKLEEILAVQRVRKLRVQPPALRKRGRDLVGALAAIAIMFVSGVAMFFAVNLTTPKVVATANTSPLTSPTAYTASSFTTAPPVPITMNVCTDIPDGRLHVCFTAGDGSEVRGYLAEGETVQIALASDSELDSKIIRGDLWLHILSPVAGWVNTRYLCKSE